MVSVLHVEPQIRSLGGITSQKFNKGSPPFKFLSKLYGVQNLFNLIWASLASEISNMSILVSMI